MKVDAIGIGAAKSGSSWLAYLLEQHPEVEISSRKEVAYFNQYDFNGKPNETAQFNVDYYHQFWEFQENKLQLEFSPQYLFDEHAAKALYDYNPKLKLIVAFRDPVKRAFSHFRYDQGFNLLIPQSTSFEQALGQYTYLKEAGLFAKQLKRFYQFFPKEQIKVFVLEEAIAQPHETVMELYSFLDIDPDFCPSFDAVNESKAIEMNWKTQLIQLPSKLKQHLEQKVPSFRKVISPLKKSAWYIQLVKGKTKMLESQTVKQEKGQMAPETAAKLYDFYKSDIADLEKLLGEKLNSWHSYNF